MNTFVSVSMLHDPLDLVRAGAQEYEISYNNGRGKQKGEK